MKSSLLVGIVAAVIAGMCPPPTATASMCAMLSYSVDDARSKLRRAAKETELEEAKDQARRAKSALEGAAMDCKCDLAYSEFDTAATRARRARDADDGDEFV